MPTAAATAPSGIGSGALRAPSLGIGRLDSLDLDPDGAMMGSAPSGGLLGVVLGSGRPSGNLLPPVVAGGTGASLAGATSYGVVSNIPPAANANAYAALANANGVGASSAVALGGRAESGLESMQSIEEALGSVRGGGNGVGNNRGGGNAGGVGSSGGADVIDRVAREWKQQQEEAAAAQAQAQQQQQQW